MAAHQTKVAIHTFPLTGRGLQAKIDIQKNSEILSASWDSVWSVEAALNEPVLGDIIGQNKDTLSVDDTLALFLLFVKLSPKCKLSSDSPRKVHVKTGIPKDYTASAFWTEEDLKICKGSSLYNLTVASISQIEDDFRSLLQRIFIRYPDVFPLAKFTLNEYTWALFTIWSRAMDFSLSDTESLRGIVPFLDMVNHSFSVDQCHAYDKTSKSVKIFAGTHYKKGDEVFINYGKVGNTKLARLYGFVIPNNPFDSFELYLSTSPDAPYFDKKSEIFQECRIDAASSFFLTLTNPLPNTVLQYLRIQRLTWSEINVAELSKARAALDRISIRNEKECLVTLVEAFESMLEGFERKATSLEVALMQNHWQVGSEAYCAAHVALGEQLILSAALKKAKTMIALLECAQCGESDGAKNILKRNFVNLGVIWKTTTFDCTWTGIPFKHIRKKLTSFNYNSCDEKLDEDDIACLEKGVFVFQTRSRLRDRQTLSFFQESSSFAKYTPFFDSNGVIHVRLVDPDSVWKITIVSSAENEEIYLCLLNSDRLADVENFMLERYGRSIFFCDHAETAQPSKWTTIFDYHKAISVISAESDQNADCVCLSFNLNLSGQQLGFSRVLSQSIVAQPVLDKSVFVECTNQLASLTSAHRFKSFLDQSTGADFLEEASGIAEKISVGLDLFNKVTSYSGNVADTLKSFNFNFGALINGLNCIANVGSMVPFVSSACNIITAIVDFAKKLEQNEKNIHGQLLQQTIDIRVKAYFSAESVWIIDDETCLSSYCAVLTDGVKTLVTIVELLKPDGIDMTDPRDNLDYTFKSILALDPIHIAFNLNTIKPLFHSAESLEFWKASRFRNAADAERLFVELCRSYHIQEKEEQSELIRFGLLQKLGTTQDGFIRAEDFGRWFTTAELKTLVASIHDSFLPNDNSINEVDLLLQPTSFLEIQSLLNERVVGTREWLIDEISKSTSKTLILEAGPGFGKSVISAIATVEWTCLYYFFKVDDIYARTAERFIKTILFQFYNRLAKLKPDIAQKLKKSILEVDANSNQTENLSVLFTEFASQEICGFEMLVIDAFDECPQNDQDLISRILLMFHESAGMNLKVLVTTRTIPKRILEIQKNPENRREKEKKGPEFKSNLAKRQENEEDLRVYFESTLPDITDRGVTVLLSKAQGCFLWAKLAVSIIRDMREESHIIYVAHTVLQKDLSQQYLTNFSHSLTMPSQYQEGLKILLSLLLALKEPLSVHELEFFWIDVWIRDHHKKLVKEANSAIDTDNLWKDGAKIFSRIFMYAISRLMLRQNCDGLVVAGHKSLRDIVAKKQLTQFVGLEEGHKNLALLSLELLESVSRNDLLHGKFGIPVNSKMRQKNNFEISKEYLVQYAARFWFEHAQEGGNNEVVLDKILTVFESPKAIHWLAILFRQRYINHAKTSLSYLSGLSSGKIFDICDGLCNIVDRFSDILLDFPTEIYTSVAIMCLNYNFAAPLFRSIEILLPSYRPRILSGAMPFWNSESMAFTTKIYQPLLKYFRKSAKVVVANGYGNIRNSSPLFEIWDTEYCSCLSFINNTADSYTLQGFEIVEIKLELETVHVILAIFEKSSNLHVWINEQFKLIQLLESSVVPKSIQVIWQDTIPFYVIVCEKAVVFFDMEFRQCVESIKEHHEIIHVKSEAFGNKIWLFTLVRVRKGKNRCLEFRTWSSENVNGRFKDFQKVESQYFADVEMFTVNPSGSQLLVAVICQSAVFLWNPITGTYETVETGICQKMNFFSEVSNWRFSNAVQNHKHVAFVADGDLFLVNFNAQKQITTLHSSIFKSNLFNLCFLSYQDRSFLLYTTGTDESVFSRFQIFDLNANLTADILQGWEFSDVDVKGSQIVLVINKNSSTQQNRHIAFYNIASLIHKLDSNEQGWRDIKIIQNNAEIDNKEPSGVGQVSLSGNGYLSLIFHPYGDVEIWDLKNWSRPICSVLKAAGSKDDWRDHCDIALSRDGNTMLVSSNIRNSLAWWDLSDKSSPRLQRIDTASISDRWELAFMSPDLTCIAFDPMAQLTECLTYISYAEVPENPQPLLVQELVEQNVEKSEESGDDESENYIGWFLSEDTNEKEVASSSRKILGSIGCTTGIIIKHTFDDNLEQSDWLISCPGKNTCSLWNLSSSMGSLDTVKIDLLENRLFLNRFPNAQNNITITFITAKVSDLDLVVSIGFSNGAIGLVLIHDEKFVTDSFSVYNLEPQYKCIKIAFAPAVKDNEDILVIEVEQKQSDTYIWSIFLLTWKGVNGGVGFNIQAKHVLMEQGQLNCVPVGHLDRISQWAFSGQSSNSHPALIILTSSGKVLRIRLNVAELIAVLELRLPRVFVEDNCQALKVFENVAAFHFINMFLVVDLGSQKKVL
ncbi:hypothetical protein HK100_006475 [Physocladia obscura]|uniref:SET domain-containing protein n=1 Tax=Physocladia obscura TaxID=109957 RepID=A0AAD5TAE7_9FUNG|nr:hypothetical protein HK100_006475 [Physocladia obscura]